MITLEQRNKLRELETKATAGEWTVEIEQRQPHSLIATIYSGRDYMFHGLNLFGRLELDSNGPANVEFVVAARNLVSKLLDALDTIDKQNKVDESIAHLGARILSSTATPAERAEYAQLTSTNPLAEVLKAAIRQYESACRAVTRNAESALDRYAQAKQSKIDADATAEENERLRKENEQLKKSILLILSPKGNLIL